MPIRRRVRTKTGREVVVSGMVGRLTWSGRPALVAAFRDVTREVTESETTRADLDLMRAMLETLPNGVAVFDPSFRCVYANRALGELLATTVEGLVGWRPEELLQHVAGLTLDPPVTADLRAPTAVESPGLVFELVKPAHRVVRRTLHRLPSATYPWASVWTDITHDHDQLARRSEEAATDPLTELLNRRAIEQTLARAIATGGRTAVVLFDIDHFKRVNDTHGHLIGDEVLKRVAAALAASARAGDFVGRWGGEEFIAVLRADAAGAMHYAERARKAVAALETSAGPVTVSAGIAQWAEGVDVVAAADAKLYEAKGSGRDRACA